MGRCRPSSGLGWCRFLDVNGRLQNLLVTLDWTNQLLVDAQALYDVAWNASTRSIGVRT